MDIRLLRFFVAVYEEKNFTNAAKSCHVSQPSISTSIRQLEEELGCSLFTRHKKGVTPTDEAHYLHPMALRVLQDLNRLPDLFRRKAKREKLCLSLMPDLSPERVALLLRQLHRSVEGLELELVDFAGPADARLTLDVLKAEAEMFIPLWEEDYVVCLPPGHPLCELERIGPEDLHGHDFIECPPCEAHQLTMGLLSCSRMAMSIVAKAEHKSQVLSLIMAGIGLSFLPTGLVENKSGVEVRPYSGQRMFRRIGLAYASATDGCRALKQVIRESQEIVQALEGGTLAASTESRPAE